MMFFHGKSFEEEKARVAAGDRRPEAPLFQRWCAPLVDQEGSPHLIKP
ncbi:MAG: hypothetical protein AB7G93_23300 [Bdellovibrionales bacterium]